MKLDFALVHLFPLVNSYKGRDYFSAFVFYSANLKDIAEPSSPLREGLGEASYKTAFLQINEYYQNLTGLATDHQCKNVGRISTIAYDERLYYNPDATPFIVKLEEKKPVGRPRGGKSEKGSPQEGCGGRLLAEEDFQ